MQCVNLLPAQLHMTVLALINQAPCVEDSYFIITEFLCHVFYLIVSPLSATESKDAF